MSFAEPRVLLVAPVLILLALLALRRERRRRKAVTTWILLERAVRHVEVPRARAWSLRDLVWVAAPLLATVALAGPRVAREGERGLVFVVDRSASMGTRDPVDGGERATRLERGRAAARARFGAPARELFVPPLPASGLPALPSVAAPDTAALLAAAAAEAAAGARVVVVTDRGLPGLPGDAGLVVVADAATNSGIVAAGLGAEGTLLVRVAGPLASRPDAVAIVAGLMDGSERAVDAGAPTEPGRWLVSGLPLFEFERLTIRLRHEGAEHDANPEDDVVVLLRNPSPLVVGFPLLGQRDLERAFAAQPEVRTVRGATGAALSVVAGQGPAVPEGGLVLLVAPIDGHGFRTRAAASVTGPILGQGEAFRDVVDTPTLPLHELESMPPDAVVLCRLGEHPLLVRSGPFLALLTIPEAGSWPRRPSFPLFVTALLRAVALDRVSSLVVHRGVTAVPWLADGVTDAEVERPDGLVHRALRGADGEFVVPLDRAGVTTLRAVGGSASGTGSLRRVSAAVLSAAATLGPFVERPITKDPAAGALRRDERELTPFVLAAAVLLFAVLVGIPALRRTGRAPRNG